MSPHLCLHYCLYDQAMSRQALASVHRAEEEQASQGRKKTEIPCKCGKSHTYISIISALNWIFRVLYAGVSLENTFSACKSYRHFLHHVHNSLYYFLNFKKDVTCPLV